ncbi:Extended synaptotagmin-3 [Mortierella sp. AD094]|nr:Extended synaptotagmin-3 [Mortierella sp. AD094]
MVRIAVDVISARNLHHEDGLLGKNDPYFELKIGMFSGQKTKTYKNAGSSLDINETLEFECEPSDDLKVKLYDDDLIKDDEIGRAKIPLQGVVQTGSVESWYSLGEGSKTRGEVLLRIRLL